MPGERFGAQDEKLTYDARYDRDVGRGRESVAHELIVEDAHAQAASWS
jgi:hypothetical protein